MVRDLTARRLPLVAAALGVTAALGVLVRPLLPTPPHAATPTGYAPTKAEPGGAAPAGRVPARAFRLAADAAAAALRCHPDTPGPGRDCGRLTVADTAGYRSGPDTVVVRLLGSLASPVGPPVPVALRVRLTGTAGTWSAAVVAP